jgi:hypothetical protein
MRLKTLVAVAVAAAFAVPLSTYAQSDKPSSGTSGAAPAAPSAGGSTAGGGAMDKDKDGSISREEAKGTPLEKDFDKLDKDKDGKLSASEQADAKAGAGATTPEAPKKQ